MHLFFTYDHVDVISMVSKKPDQNLNEKIFNIKKDKGIFHEYNIQLVYIRKTDMWLVCDKQSVCENRND